jgi:heme-degrading monooxygenase HmoA
MLELEAGFRRYTIMRTGPDSLVSITGWETHDEAQLAARRLSAWVAEVMGNTLESVENYVAEVVDIAEASAAVPAYGRLTDLRFQPGKMDEMAARAGTEFLPVLARQPGFIRHVTFRPEDDRLMTFAAFASREQLAAAEAAVQSWGKYVASLTTAVQRHAGEVVWSIRKD